MWRQLRANLNVLYSWTATSTLPRSSGPAAAIITDIEARMAGHVDSHLPPCSSIPARSMARSRVPSPMSS